MSRLRATVASEGRWLLTEPPVDIEKLADEFRAMASVETAHVVIAVDENDTVIGSAGMTDRSPGPVEFGMQVDTRFRRRGVGAALLDEVVRWSRDRGSHKVMLEVWPHNDPAIALYRSRGFVREGLLRQQYRRRDGELWDAVVMGLLLR